jgi:selenocysteine lyase/cysteine desulfurase
LAEVPIDFLAADGHKWMLGPEGAGVLFVRRGLLDLLRPLGVGWNSVVHAHDYGHVELNLRPDAARYEGGSQNMVGFIALGASLELLVNHGLGPSSSSLAQRVLYITDHACMRLQEIGAEIVSSREGAQRSGIVAFRWRDRNLDSIRRQCREEGVVLSCRGGCLRISPHAYTNEEDVDRLIQVLRR